MEVSTNTTVIESKESRDHNYVYMLDFDNVWKDLFTVLMYTS